MLTEAFGPGWSENSSLSLPERSSTTERDQIFAAELGKSSAHRTGSGKAEITFKRLGFKMSAGEEKTKERLVCVGG